jgi:hypothetical protein
LQDSADSHHQAFPLDSNSLPALRQDLLLQEDRLQTTMSVGGEVMRKGYWCKTFKHNTGVEVEFGFTYQNYQFVA